MMQSVASCPITPAAQSIASMAHAALPALRTAQLTLRPARLGDFDTYASITMSDRSRYIGGSFSAQTAWLDFCQICAGWLLRGTGLWAVEHPDTSSPLGFVLVHQEYGDTDIELGFLMNAKGEGRGYAFQVAKAARDYAFGTFGLTRLISYIDPENRRAIALAERLGAQSEGLLSGVLVYRHPGPEALQ